VFIKFTIRLARPLVLQRKLCFRGFRGWGGGGGGGEKQHLEFKTRPNFQFGKIKEKVGLKFEVITEVKWLSYLNGERME